MKRLLLLCLLAFVARANAQTSLYVDSSAAVSGSGNSWGTAFQTLNEALDVVNTGSASTKYNIYIAKGTYYPTRLQSGNQKDSTFLITRAGVRMYGGYVAGGTTRNVTANPTVLSGNIMNAAASSDNSYHIMVVAGVSGSDTILVDGLNFHDGSATTNFNTVLYNGQGVLTKYGGAVYNVNVTAPVVFNNCSFLRNTSAVSGGAIYSSNARPVIMNCTFSNNTTGGDGGAIFTNSNSVHQIFNSSFTNNSANGSGSGGAVFSSRTRVTLGTPLYIGCTFTGNVSGSWGGAVAEVNVAGYPAKFDGCSFAGNQSTFGGGLYLSCDTAFASAFSTVVNCTFSGNTALTAGGGLYGAYSVLTYMIDSSNFLNNKAFGQGGGAYLVTSGTPATNGFVRACNFMADSATLGGGLYNEKSGAEFMHCNFILNWAQHGAGLYNYQSPRIAVNNTSFSGNYATQTGGGLLNYAVPTTFTMTNCLISGNKAGTIGGGMYDSAGSAPIITNCTFAGDTAVLGRGIANVSLSAPTIYNSIIWEGTTNGIYNQGGGSAAVIAYSTVQGGYSGTGINMNNPLFQSPAVASNAPTLAGDYHLLGCSPAIDSGNNAFYAGLTDLSGNNRIFGTSVDLGAYEYQYVYPTRITGDSGVCIGNILQLTNATAGGTWTTSSPGTASVSAAGMVTGLAVGTTTITYTIGGACPAILTKNVQVSVVDTGVTVSGTVLTSRQGSGATYQWIDCGSGQAISGQTSQSYTATNNGDYAVVVNLNGCKDTSGCVSIRGLGIGQANASNESLRLYPNPTSGQLTVQLGNQTPTMIRISDMAGKLMLEVKPQNATTRINLNGFIPGLYLVEVLEGTERHTGRVSIIR